jgi:hypothetical protein
MLPWLCYEINRHVNLVKNVVLKSKELRHGTRSCKRHGCARQILLIWFYFAMYPCVVVLGGRELCIPVWSYCQETMHPRVVVLARNYASLRGRIGRELCNPA